MFFLNSGPKNNYKMFLMFITFGVDTTSNIMVTLLMKWNLFFFLTSS